MKGCVTPNLAPTLHRGAPDIQRFFVAVRHVILNRIPWPLVLNGRRFYSFDSKMFLVFSTEYISLMSNFKNSK